MKTPFNLRGVRFRAESRPYNTYRLIFNTSTKEDIAIAVSFADDLGACDYTSSKVFFACTITGDTMQYQFPWRLDRFNEMSADRY